jgi:hypothetical protein
VPSPLLTIVLVSDYMPMVGNTQPHVDLRSCGGCGWRVVLCVEVVEDGGGGGAHVGVFSEGV